MRRRRARAQSQPHKGCIACPGKAVRRIQARGWLVTQRTVGREQYEFECIAVAQPRTTDPRRHQRPPSRSSRACPSSWPSTASLHRSARRRRARHRRQRREARRSTPAREVSPTARASQSRKAHFLRLGETITGTLDLDEATDLRLRIPETASPGQVAGRAIRRRDAAHQRSGIPPTR